MNSYLKILLGIALGAITTACPGAPGDFAERPEVSAFIDEMVARHGFQREDLLAEFDGAQSDPRVLRLIAPPDSPGVRSWKRYRARFIEPRRIRAGLEFRRNHADDLARAQRQYGVPAEIVLAIIGVETVYGRNTGGFPLLESLATLAFDYPPRAGLFRDELENLLLLARESARSPASFTGSYAGAIGYPQFLPSSVRQFAVDFDGDGRIDLENSPSDAIGSVARFLADHGWQPGEPIADKVRPARGFDVAPLLDAGIEPSLDGAALAAAGLHLRAGQVAATLVDLVTPGQATEYWLGYRNFYVLTRYNRSSFYAMAVLQLARALSGAPRPATTKAR